MKHVMQAVQQPEKNCLKRDTICAALSSWNVFSLLL